MSFRGECAFLVPACATSRVRQAPSANAYGPARGALGSKFSAITENILVYFDPAKGGSQDFLAAVQSALNQYSLVVFKAERTLAAQSTVQERRLQEN